jgi:hypothetical protein
MTIYSVHGLRVASVLMPTSASRPGRPTIYEKVEAENNARVMAAAVDLLVAVQKLTSDDPETRAEGYADGLLAVEKALKG